MDKTQLEAFLTTLDHWALFFTALVVVGVAGELFTHLWYSRTNERLLALQHIEEKQLQTQIAQANERTAELTRENLEIRRKMAWRSLIGAERSTFISSLRAPGRQATVVYLQDGEATEYADSIFSALQEAQWAVGKNYRTTYDPGPMPHGIICRIATHPDPVVISLVKALQTIDTNARTEIIQTYYPAFIEIVVGLRPLE